MADFLRDTAVESDPARPGGYRASLSEDWAVWGPNGGFVAAVAFRAALAASRQPRPASFHCHFLAVGRFEPVAIEVTPLGGGKRAESLRVDVSQDGRLLLAATAWFVSDDLRGYEHDFGARPDVPAPEELKSYAELEGDQYAQWYPIWRSIEGRPTRWREPPAEPEWHTWLRFNDTPVRTDTDDAIRQLYWLDFPGWNATIAAHAWPFPFLTPNLDLTVQFHRFDPRVDWILCEGNVPTAENGLVGCVGRLWTPDGRLLATGTSKHVCRPNPGYEEELARAREEGLPSE